MPPVAPPKAEPGKPIYERKPAARARPTLEKRFEEGERKLHPVRARPGIGERRAARIEPVIAPPRPARAITITEGRNRQVRRMVEALGAKVLKLVRTRIGTIEIGALEPGQHRELTSEELAALRQ